MSTQHTPTKALEWIREYCNSLRKGTDDWFDLVEIEAVCSAALSNEHARDGGWQEKVARDIAAAIADDAWADGGHYDDLSEDRKREWNAVEASAREGALRAFAMSGPNYSDEYMSVSISRDGVVTSHNAYDANFDEMVVATRKIIEALQDRYANRLKCPFAAGKELRKAADEASTSNDTPPGSEPVSRDGEIERLREAAQPFADLLAGVKSTAPRYLIELVICPEGESHPFDWRPRIQALSAALGAGGKNGK